MFFLILLYSSCQTQNFYHGDLVQFIEFWDSKLGLTSSFTHLETIVYVFRHFGGLLTLNLFSCHLIVCFLWQIQLLTSPAMVAFGLPSYIGHIVFPICVSHPIWNVLAPFKHNIHVILNDSYEPEIFIFYFPSFLENLETNTEANISMFLIIQFLFYQESCFWEHC